MTRENETPPHRFLPPDERVVAPYRLTPQIAVRLSILGFVALAAFGLLFLRLWSLQIVSGPRYAQAAAKNRERTTNIEAPRGPILDRFGRTLVENQPAPVVQVWPTDLASGARGEAELAHLARVLGLRIREVTSRLKDSAGDPSVPVELRRRVGLGVVAYLAERAKEFPGVQVTEASIRRYPYGPLAAHLLGYVGPVTKEQLQANRKGLHLGDQVGQSGIEARYDNLVRGKDGLASLRVDSLGRPRGAVRLTRTPTVGNALRLTIDLRVQRASENALAAGIETAHRNKNLYANGGAVVALDPRNGAIIALASNPTYNAAVFEDRSARAHLAPLLDPAAAKDANYPIINRATQGLYPPGSTFKPVTALAAMSEGLLAPYSPLPCTSEVTIAGQVFRNWKPGVDTQMTLPQALAASCDTYFYRVGKAFYDLPGRRGQPLQAWAKRFGFGSPTGLDLGGDAAGLLPTIQWRRETYTAKSDPCCWQIDRLWKPGDSVQLAIGQKDLLVTPLQMARFYALIANGGQLVQPHILEDVEVAGVSGTQAQVLQAASFTPPTSVGLDRVALTAVRQGLYDGAHSSNGTSSGVFGAFSIPVSGKTGTAEKSVQIGATSRVLSQSWWCGYGPSDAARLVVCVVIENGGFGGEAAAPTALKVFESFFGRKTATPTTVIASD